MFEGDIPEGQYGAGHVEIGTYKNLSPLPLSEALAQGNVEIELHGHRLKGKHAPICLAGGGRPENWPLIKSTDRYAPSSRQGMVTTQPLDS
ncbi:MAG TPA: DNA polymerase ligase N-terminal domain-containing protein [Verrucomicrobiae bacterium]|nr:DNA polymerase ligase N-terminal domain-containing protein [Verrucomicrobiae bacterium]